MSDFRKFSVEQSAIDSAKSAGMIGAIPDRLLRMAKLSTPCRHVQGNRRFENMVLLVESGVIKQVSRLEEEAKPTITPNKFGRPLRVQEPDDLEGNQASQDEVRPVVKTGKLSKEELDAAVSKFLKK